MSVVLALLFEEKQTAQAKTILLRIGDEGLLVPPLWWSELENGILVGERRGRTTAAQSAEFLKLVRALPIQTDDAPAHRISDDILVLGRKHHLTGYDATYLELAVREKIPLATFDAQMRRCAPKTGVTILPR